MSPVFYTHRDEYRRSGVPPLDKWISEEEKTAMEPNLMSLRALLVNSPSGVVRIWLS